MSDTSPEQPAALPSELKFAVPKHATSEDIGKFMAVAAKRGFAYTGPPVELALHAPDATARLAAFLEQTFPPNSTDDYLTKEHFGAIGATTSLNRTAVGRLFGLICFPVSGLQHRHAMAYHPRDAIAIPRTELGLTVVTRDAVDLPASPVYRPRTAPNIPSAERYYKKIYPDDPITVENAAIQIAGLLDLPNSDRFTQEVCTPHIRSILPVITNHVTELISR